MIIVTGGAGFIGSAIVWKLGTLGRTDTIVVDRLGHGEKWRNLTGLRYHDFIAAERFIADIRADAFPCAGIEAVIHMGACSATTETDADYLLENNFRQTADLAGWCLERGIRFIYASSAATYGDGSRGYRDDDATTRTLAPLNMYGYSKQMFDMYALERGWQTGIVGLKFFNVFGPNENHKGDMRSVVNKAHAALVEGRDYPLFRSHRPDFADGEQRRDFVWIKDVVNVVMHFLERPGTNGIFNVGSGHAASFNELLTAVYRALDRTPEISYVDMPQHLRERYQYFTEADLTRLRAAGYNGEFTPLDTAVREYVRDYLAHDTRLV